MARGIHDVDLVILVGDGGVLGEDGDAPLPLQVAGVHDPVDGDLIFTVDAALLQHFVDQGGFAVVNVGDDGNVSNFFLRCHIFLAPLLRLSSIFSQLKIIAHNQKDCNIFGENYERKSCRAEPADILA